MKKKALSLLLIAALAACHIPGYESFTSYTAETTSSTSGSSTAGSSGPGSTSSTTTGTEAGSDSAVMSAGESTASTGTSTSTETSDGTTTSTGTVAVCGDGVVGPGEECDDGNSDDTDGCPTTCLRDRWVFVTAALMKPDLNGAEGADSLCRQYALQSGAADDTWKTFKAWVSDSTTDVRDRLPSGVQARYVRTDGVVVAYGVEQFYSGSIEAPINVDEFGAPQGGGVITGTRTDGTAVPGSTHCDDWSATGNQLELHYGSISATDEAWTLNPTMEANPTACISGWRIYCVEGG